MTFRRIPPIILYIALFLLVLIFFLIGIQFPKTVNFDEFHYVPAAKFFLSWHESQNWEHPPLAKWLMAGGIALFGDIPLGWRFMSAVFGALTLVGMVLLGKALFRSNRAAFWVGALTLFNQLLYVQARIGMLDTFMFGFIVFAFVLLVQAWSSDLTRRQTLKRFYGCGALLGLGIACKWSAIVAWGLVLGIVLGVKLFQKWGVVFKHQKTTDWYHPKLFQGLRLKHFIGSLVVVPLTVYFITFLPFLWMVTDQSYGFFDLFTMQLKMWDGQLRVVTRHPYMSAWTSWPLMLRPIWYAFDREPGGFVRGVILLGNPLIMWGGLLAIFMTGISFIRERSRETFLILVFYLGLYLCWGVIPRKIAFYYYYYPAGMILSLALVWGFEFFKMHKFKWIFLTASFGLFVYFFPILSGQKIDASEFMRWMWFRSWI